MKTTILFLLYILTGITSYSQKPNPAYDSTLAKSYGADDYGMKNYILVILKTGINQTTDKALIDSLFAGHLKNIGDLVKQNKLIVAGPLGKNANRYRGIFILNVKSIEEAEKILETDPAIKEKLLEADLYNWYGSAALHEYINVSEKISKYSF
jgi:uncharacterized protein YciI